MGEVSQEIFHLIHSEKCHFLQYKVMANKAAVFIALYKCQLFMVVCVFNSQQMCQYLCMCVFI